MIATMLALLLLPPPAAGAAAAPQGRLVDLTHPFEEKTIYWPTESGFKHQTGFRGRTKQGFWYYGASFSAPEHGGTHIDAPAHFWEGGHTADQVPLERLMGPGAVVDVVGACDRDRDYRVTVADLDAWEAAHGRLPAGAVVLLRTGFGRRWPDRARYLGTAERGEAAVKKLHFPGLSVAAARRLIERKIAAVGIDTASIDHGPSTLFETHVELFSKAVPAFENVAAMDALPPKGFTVIALPMKIKGGSGGPLRIIAVLDGPSSE